MIMLEKLSDLTEEEGLKHKIKERRYERYHELVCSEVGWKSTFCRCLQATNS